METIHIGGAAAGRGREMFCRDLTIRRPKVEEKRRQTTDAADAHRAGIRNGPTDRALQLEVGPIVAMRRQRPTLCNEAV